MEQTEILFLLLMYAEMSLKFCPLFAAVGEMPATTRGLYKGLHLAVFVDISNAMFRSVTTGELSASKPWKRSAVALFLFSLLQQ